MRAFPALVAAALVLASGAYTARPLLHHRATHVRTFDVLVDGGTPAGIAAAVSAARRGMRVAFVTGSAQLGGDLTGAMLTQWDLQNAPDGTDLQSDMFHEFYAEIPDGFRPADAARYFRERIRMERGISWFDGASNARANGVRSDEGRRVASLLFTSRGRIRALSASCVIDATDNADLAVAAGAHYDVGEQDQGRDLDMQPATLIFTLAGVDWHAVNPQGGDQSAGYAQLLRSYRPLSPRAIVPDANFQLNADGTVMVNAIDILGVDGRSAASVREATAIAKAESSNLVPFLRAHVEGFEHARIAAFAPRLYVRETRHVRGLVWIDATYIWNGERPYDTIALAAFPFDVHPVHKGEVGGDGWLEEPHVYGIPLRALVPYGFENLLVVGPSISAKHTASGSVRVMPTTIAEGEAAGEACAQSIRGGYSVRRMALSPRLSRLFALSREAFRRSDRRDVSVARHP
jgi:hypothetical protein